MQAAPIRAIEAFRVGAFSAPAGIEEATSTNGSLFFERASPSELVRGIASGDDRTPMGVHEGLSCFACHQGHQQSHPVHRKVLTGGNPCPALPLCQRAGAATLTGVETRRKER